MPPVRRAGVRCLWRWIGWVLSAPAARAGVPVRWAVAAAQVEDFDSLQGGAAGQLVHPVEVAVQEDQSQLTGGVAAEQM